MEYRSFFHLLHPDDRAAVVALFMSLLAQQQELQLLDQQQKQQAAAPAGGKRGRAAAAAQEEAKDGILSNCGDRRLQRGQISCRVHAQTAFVRVDLSLRCGTSGVVCFARPQ